MPTVELIYDPDCPNAEKARQQLLRALAKVGLKWDTQEWNRAAPESPDYVQQYGSPTILVNKKDVAGSESISGDKACRVYQNDKGQLSGVPPIEMITSALTKADK